MLAIYNRSFVLSFSDRTGLNDNSRCSNLGKHLSKSASELSCRDCNTDSPNNSPLRTKSVANPAVAGVIQKTHGFFSTLKVTTIKFVLFILFFKFFFTQHRWSRGRSKERGRRSPHDGDMIEHESTDYAADNSSEHSSSATPYTQSPRHRATTIGGSPLARPLFRNNKSQSMSKENLTADGERAPSTSQNAIDLLHVSNFVNL